MYLGGSSYDYLGPLLHTLVDMTGVVCVVGSTVAPMGGKYVLSWAVRAASSSFNFLLLSVPMLEPDLIYPDPVLRHLTEGQLLMIFNNNKKSFK